MIYMISLLEKEKKQYSRQMDPVGFQSSPLLTNVELLFRQTNSLVELQYRSIYAT